MPRSVRAVILLAILAAIGAGIWFSLPGGFLHHWFQPDPQLDPATARTQSGYTLAEAHAENDASSSAAAFVLIQVPSLPQCQRENEQDGYTLYALPGGGIGPYNSFTTPSTGPVIQVTGQTSEGDVLPLSWQIVGDARNPKFLRVDIPGGYSNACRFVDITLVTRTGAFPKWRIARLPSMRQNIPDAPKVQTAQAMQGISISARSWHSGHQVYLQVLPVLPPGSHQWEIGPRQSWSEWEKFDQQHTPTDPLNYKPIEGRSGHFTQNDALWFGSLTTMFPGDYRSASKFVRLDCGLIQFETLDERVTFPSVSIQHDLENSGQTPDYDAGQTYYLTVPRPITLTTPSGIAVTLPAQGTNTSSADLLSGDINVRLTVKPSYPSSELPHSPLVRQFRKPVAVTIQFTPPDSSNGWMNLSDDTKNYTLLRPENPKWRFKMTRQQMQQTPLHLAPPSRRDLTIIVRQRVELQRIPLSFTVPVAETPPADIHW